jgi:hypothetical protein
MSEPKKPCDLCGLTIEVPHYILKTKDGDKKEFCCDGCQGIYQMLHESQIAPESEQHSKEKT